MQDFDPDLLRIEKLPLLGAKPVFKLNEIIFGEERLINHFDHQALTFYEASYKGISVGFKVGYALSANEFYSAKGGVLSDFRRNGIAEKLTYIMILDARKSGYKVLSFDTLPIKFPGMFELGKKIGFVQTNLEFDDYYQTAKIRMSLVL